MKTNKALSLLAIIVYIITTVGNAALAEPDSVACPASLATRQEPVKDHPGWTVFDRDNHSFLDGITIYEGSPEGLHIPDLSDRQSDDDDGHTPPVAPSKSSEVDVWTLKKGKEYWIKCSYLGNTVGLTRKLPPGITKCSVKYEGMRFISESCE